MSLISTKPPDFQGDDNNMPFSETCTKFSTGHWGWKAIFMEQAEPSAIECDCNDNSKNGRWWLVITAVTEGSWKWLLAGPTPSQMQAVKAHQSRG